MVCRTGSRTCDDSHGGKYRLHGDLLAWSLARAMGSPGSGTGAIEVLETLQ